MRWIRFIALALVSFIAAFVGAFLAPTRFLNRALSVAACTVFSFNSTLCAANLAQSSERAVAAFQPAIETTNPNVSPYLQAQQSELLVLAPEVRLVASFATGRFCNVQNQNGGWWLWVTGDMATDPCGVLLNKNCTGSDCRVVSSGTYLLNGENEASVNCQGYSKTFVGNGGKPLNQAFDSVVPFRPFCTFQVRRKPSSTSPPMGQEMQNIDGIPVSGTPVPQLQVFDLAMVQFMQERSIPAGTLAVMKDGRLLVARGYGYSDPNLHIVTAPDTMMRIASVTKPFTAAAIKKLIREGKISPDTKVFPLLGISPAGGELGDTRLNDITVQHLLEHKGGWDGKATFDPMFRSIEIAAALGKRSPASSLDIITFMLGQPLQFTPGTRESYSNFGYCVLGRAIEKVTGQSYTSYVQQAILSPLGITEVELGHTLPEERNPKEVGWYSDPARGPSVFQPDKLVAFADGAFYLEAMDANGGLIASGIDLVRFAQGYWLTGEPRTGDKYTWIFFGSLPGNHSMLLWRPDGVNIAVLFNQRTDSSGLEYDSIRDVMNNAADSVRNWPG